MKFIQIQHHEVGTATVPETAVRHYEARGWTVAGEATGPGGDLLFDPNEHTVSEVLAHLEYSSVEERDRVLDAEKNGKARVGIVGA